MNARWALPVCLLIASSGVAQQNAAEIESRAAHAHGGDCVRLNLQAAYAQVDGASRSYDKSDVESARAALNSVVADAERTVNCALHASRSQKNAEIELRRLSRRMTELQRSLDLDERPYVEHAHAAVEKQHDRLLREIFGDAADHAQTNP
jgi:hypothetical protein